MKTNNITEMMTYGYLVNNAICVDITTDGRIYTTVEDVQAFFTSVREDFHIKESSSEDFVEAA